MLDNEKFKLLPPAEKIKFIENIADYYYKDCVEYKKIMLQIEQLRGV